MTNSRCPV